MRMRAVLLLGLLLACGSVRIHALPGPHQGEGKPASAASRATSKANEGEKRFQENCGRCHHPPESISPREAKAVLRQMRIRAMLTAEDERLILRYLSP
jgi:cytochrome c5